MKKIRCTVSEMEMRITKSNPTGTSNDLLTTKQGWTRIGYVYPTNRKDICFKTIQKKQKTALKNA
jgi:hypothetical protein